MRRAFDDDASGLLDSYFSDVRKSDMAAFPIVADSASSPRSLSSANFSFISQEVDTGNVACTAELSVVIHTRLYGNITIDNQAVDFRIERKRNGRVVDVAPGYLTWFGRAFGDKIRNIFNKSDF